MIGIFYIKPADTKVVNILLYVNLYEIGSDINRKKKETFFLKL